MDAVLEATTRTTFGKNEARRTRRDGLLPAVVYGAAEGGARREATAIAVSPKALLKILHSESGANTLISLKVAGAADARVMVKEYQLDPITHHLLHADFYALAMDKAITVTLPIVLKGESRGVKQQGGIVDFVTRDIEVQCLPTDMPGHIDVDIAELMLNQSVRVKDLAKEPKWTAMTDGEAMIVHVVMPKAEESAQATDAAAAEAAPAAAAEPEVIKKGKDEKEEKEKK